MKKIAVGKSKAKCLSLMDEVNSTGEEIIITKHGKEITKLAPISKKKTRLIFGYLEDSINILGDIVSPLDEL